MPVITNLETVKISELPVTSKTSNMRTLATNSGTNKSQALELTAVAEATVAANAAATAAGNAAAKANKAAAAADEARENIQEDLAGKADLDTEKKYVSQFQLDPLYGYQTGAVMGKGLFNSSAPALTSDVKDKPYTTALLFRTPQSAVSGNKFIYNEGTSGTSGLGASVFMAGRNLLVTMRGQTIISAGVPLDTLCLVVISYEPNQYCSASINTTYVMHDPDYSYQHKPERFIIGGMESTATADLLKFNIIFARRFNFAMTATEMSSIWNNGHPERWRVPDDWRNVSSTQLGCVLDLVPSSLTPTLWRDVSGQGNDVPYVPHSGSPTQVELSYENEGYPDTITGETAPTTAPNFVGQTYIDTVNKNIYRAVGTSSAADWKIV